MPRTKTSAKPVEPLKGTPANGELAKGKTSDAEVVPEAAASGVKVEASDEPSRLDQLRLRVALDASRFVMLVRGRRQQEPIREALSEEQRGIYDSIVEASEAGDFDTEDGIARVAGFALMFGGEMKADPLTVFKLLGVLDNMTKLALVELSKLLEVYYEELQASSGQK